MRTSPKTVTQHENLWESKPVAENSNSFINSLDYAEKPINKEEPPKLEAVSVNTVIDEFGQA